MTKFIIRIKIIYKMEKEKIGTFKTATLEDRFDIFFKECMHKGTQKFKVDLVNPNGDTVAFLKYIHDEGVREFSFSGVYVNPAIRNNYVGQGLLEFLFLYANANNGTFELAELQRKPIAMLLLSKYGFEAEDSNPKRQIDIHPPTSERVKISFTNQHTRNNFARSNIMRHSQQYEIVDNGIHEVVASVFYRSQYTLIDEEKCEERRKAMQEFLTIEI